MADHLASGRVLEKNGFVLRWTGLREDWGRSALVLVNKYMLKLTPEEKSKSSEASIIIERKERRI